MDRNPPQKVTKILRQEVRFACPVPDCGDPVLTWHHFDPPWCDKQHHNPEGMIALCISDHRRANGGNWTRSKLRSFKQNPPKPELIRKKFFWSDSTLLYRLGGNYAANCQYILTISGQPIIWHTISQEGRILLSLDFRNEEDSQVLFIDENSLSAEYCQIKDLSINTNENHLKIWIGKRKVGLELRLRHLLMDEFATQLDKDATRALSVLQKLLPSNLVATMPKPDVSFVLDFAEKECLNSDNKIAILDILNATLFSRGKCVTIRDGIVTGSQFHFCFSFNNSGAAFSL